jgi:hypothetical protein
VPISVKPPRINSRFACIVDRDAIVLAAVISSYLFEPESYLPVFLFPNVEVPKTDEATLMSESYVANLIGDHASFFIGNSLARMGRCEYVVLAGLSEHQKSFLKLPRELKTIEIMNVSDIHPKLSPHVLPGKGELRCKESDILSGLFIAQKRKKRLVIDQKAQALPEIVNLQKGLVIVENMAADASPVIAINYANSVNASVMLVDPLPEYAKRDVQRWIQDWKKNDDFTQFQRIQDAVLQRIGGISFSQFEYATFFTEGLPYSLILENVIPCTHVHLSLRPDIFVMNSIMFNDGEPFHAAVVFSPVFFSDEETSWLCDFFSHNEYYLRPLIGRDATLANMDFHAQYFPYDLMHICSHGGEVDGYEMSGQFTDTDGNIHLVEFDEVVGFTPVPDSPEMVSVHRKVFPRKLDGFVWMSTELDKQNIPGHVYREMWKWMLELQDTRKKKDRVAMSCAIACADSIHQGEFNVLASHSSPLVFNNTCWSWNEVASFFLACGARGYIGTLWDIDNEAAVLAAKTFYQHVFSGSVLAAFHKAVRAIDSIASRDIYIYWGLHFSTLSPGQSFEASQNEVRKEFTIAIANWIRKIELTKSAEIRKNSIRVLKSILREVLTNFDSVEIRRLEAEAKRSVPELSQVDISRGMTEHESPAIVASRDCPIEYRKSNQQKRRW